MVHCHKSFFFVTPLKKRELCYPEEFILALIKKFHLTRQFQTKCAKHCPDNLVLICRKEKKVSILSTHCLYQRIHLFFLHKFCKRRFYCAIFLDRNVCKSLCAVIFRKAYQFINFLSRHTSLTFGIDTTNSSALLDCPFEHNKLTIFYNFCHILKFHAKTGIRFIRAITIHCFLPCHSRNRKCYFLS